MAKEAEDADGKPYLEPGEYERKERSYRLSRRRSYSACVPWAAEPVFSGGPPALSGSEEFVRQWFDGCLSRTTMQVDVLLKGGSLYAMSFPACAKRRADSRTEREHKTLVFRFEESATLIGEEFRGLGTRTIEGNIWRAGSEADAILLGVSFVTGKRILLNTIHIAMWVKRLKPRWRKVS
jgi:hypothetical protein